MKVNILLHTAEVTLTPEQHAAIEIMRKSHTSQDQKELYGIVNDSSLPLEELVDENFVSPKRKSETGKKKEKSFQNEDRKRKRRTDKVHQTTFTSTVIYALLMTLTKILVCHRESK